MTATTKQILLALRELLSDERRWTKGSLARNMKEVPVSPLSAEACKYCLIGGLCKITGDHTGLTDAYRAARDALSKHGLALLNDTSTHARVVEVIDDAIWAE